MDTETKCFECGGELRREILDDFLGDSVEQVTVFTCSGCRATWESGSDGQPIRVRSVQV